MQQLDKYRTPENFRGASKYKVQLWLIFQSLFVAPSPQFLYGWRSFCWRLFGAEVAEGVLIRPGVKVNYPWKVKIGQNSWLGDGVELYALGEILIEDNVVISQKSYLCTGGHDHQSTSFDIFQKPIIVKSGAWVATDVFIAPGVVIGANSLVGARSSVFKDVEEGMIYVGNPARKLSPRY